MKSVRLFFLCYAINTHLPIWSLKQTWKSCSKLKIPCKSQKRKIWLKPSTVVGFLVSCSNMSIMIKTVSQNLQDCLLLLESLKQFIISSQNSLSIGLTDPMPLYSTNIKVLKISSPRRKPSSFHSVDTVDVSHHLVTERKKKRKIM